MIDAPRRAADFFHFDREFFGRVANWIANEVRGTNRVAYCAVNLCFTMGLSGVPCSMVHVIVGVRAPLRRRAPMHVLPWTTRKKAERKKIKIDRCREPQVLVEDRWGPWRSGLMTTTLNRPALGQAGKDSGKVA